MAFMLLLFITEAHQMVGGTECAINPFLRAAATQALLNALQGRVFQLIRTALPLRVAPMQA